jgi:hypothetical protein
VSLGEPRELLAGAVAIGLELGHARAGALVEPRELGLERRHPPLRLGQSRGALARLAGLPLALLGGLRLELGGALALGAQLRGGLLEGRLGTLALLGQRLLVRGGGLARGPLARLRRALELGDALDEPL